MKSNRQPAPATSSSMNCSRGRALRGVLAALVLASALVPRAGGAQPTDNKARAEGKLTAAREDFARADYQSALGKIEEAAALFPSPKLHFNFGVVYAKLGRNVEALEAYQRFLAQAGPGDSTRRGEAERQIAELRERVATLVLVADTVAADVFVDGRLYGTTPLPRPMLVNPGSHQLVVQKAGLAVAYTDRIDARAGAEIRIDARLGPAPPPPPPLPPAKAPLGRGRILSLVLGGVGVAASGVGVAYGLIARSRANEASDACPNQCVGQGGVDQWNQAQQAGNISTAAFVVGAAGIASGLVLWLHAKPVAESGPQIGLGPGGLQVRGIW